MQFTVQWICFQKCHKVQTIQINISENNTNDNTYKYSLLSNLKYNRIDMKKKLSQGPTKMTLRSRPSSLRKQSSIIDGDLQKKKKRNLKSQRKFGVDITNKQDVVRIQEELPEILQETSAHIQIEPYMLSIGQHMISIDDIFHQKIEQKLGMQSHLQEPDVTPEMRTVLIEWLAKVSEKIRVKPETLHICVQLVDYTLIFETQRINRRNFQLLGITALFIASKYNEIHTLEADKYVLLCDGLYTNEHLFEMEGLILIATHFNLQFPTIQQFIAPIFLGQSILDPQLQSAIKMLTNLSIFQFKLFNRFKKCHLASVIFYFANKLVNNEKLKSKEMKQRCNISEETFVECLRILINLYKEKKGFIVQ